MVTINSLLELQNPNSIHIKMHNNETVGLLYLQYIPHQTTVHTAYPPPSIYTYMYVHMLIC